MVRANLPEKILVATKLKQKKLKSYNTHLSTLNELDIVSQKISTYLFNSAIARLRRFSLELSDVRKRLGAVGPLWLRAMYLRHDTLPCWSFLMV